MNTCPLCNQVADIQREPRRHNLYHVDCNTCGRYIISEYFWIYTDKKAELEKIRHLLSGLAREINENGLTSKNFPEFTVEDLEETLKNYLIPDASNVEEKAKKLLSYLRKKTQFFGEVVTLDIATDYPVAYARNEKEFEALLDLLQEKNYATYTLVVGADKRTITNVVISANGWSLTNELRKKGQMSENAFIAMWFDDSMKGVKTAIENAIRTNNFNPTCVWDDFFKERIMDKALSGIRDSRFVVVNLTGDRNSVFFEAGFAQGLNIETIYIYDKTKLTTGSSLEFYVRHYQCYGYTTSEELQDILQHAIAARIAKKN